MPVFKLNEKLLQFGLFQGMAKADMERIVTHARLGFHKYAPGETLVGEGEACDRLLLLLDGTVTVVSVSANHGYSLEETMHSPNLFQPECLFGLYQHFSHTYRAATPCSVMAIAKAEVFAIMTAYEVFRINFLNIISAQVQKREAALWRVHANTVRQRVIDFIAQRCIYPAGDKLLRVKMTQLADEIGSKRIYVSQALNQLQADGLLILRRGEIHIPSLERLLM